MAVPYYIVKIDPNTGEVLETFLNLRHVERITGLDHSNLSKVINGKAQSLGGFRWEKRERSAELPAPTLPMLKKFAGT